MLVVGVAPVKSRSFLIDPTGLADDRERAHLSVLITGRAWEQPNNSNGNRSRSMSEDRLRAIRWHGAIAPDIEQCDGADRIVEADGPVLSAGRMVQTKLAFARTPLSGQTEDEFAPSKARMHPWSVIPLSGLFLCLGLEQAVASNASITDTACRFGSIADSDFRLVQLLEFRRRCRGLKPEAQPSFHRTSDQPRGSRRRRSACGRAHSGSRPSIGKPQRRRSPPACRSGS